jgi:tetratricopeptide (TPR) repeat protein
MRTPHAVFAMLIVCVGASHAPAQERTDFPPAAHQRYEDGKELQKKGELDAAIRAFEEAIDLGMQAFPRVHLSRASSNLELQRYDVAIAQYTKFIEQFGLDRSCRH